MQPAFFNVLLRGTVSEIYAQLAKSEILPILGSGRLRRESTLIFQFFLMKFGQMVRVTKKMTLTYNGGEP